MKRIGERARTWTKTYPRLKDGEYTNSDVTEMMANSYIQGATDQRRIDIDNLCSYMERFNEDSDVKVDIESWREFIMIAMGI